MALRMWASSTANALKVSCASKAHLAPAFAFSRCFSSVLDGLKYASSHEWVKHEGSVATVGITDHAQDHLGEVVFVEVPEPGVSISKGSSFGAVESVKATSDVNSPISGEVVEVNTKLSESPGLMSWLLNRTKVLDLQFERKRMTNSMLTFDDQFKPI